MVALFCHAVIILISLALRSSAASHTHSTSSTLIEEEDDVKGQHVGRFSKSDCVTCMIIYDSSKCTNNN